MGAVLLPVAHSTRRPSHGPVASGLPVALPMQFASLEQLDARVRAVLAQPDGIVELSPLTKAWMAHAYRGFRAFLKAARCERAWLTPDLPQQLRILDRWVATMRAEGKARSTVNTRWRAMRSLLNRLAAEDGALNPFAFIGSPHPGYARMGCLTPEAAAQVLLHAQHEPGQPPRLRARNAALVGVMLLAGLRKREVLRLRSGDVVMDAMRAEGAITVAAGKGRHGGKPRTVPMTPQLAAICAAYEATRAPVDRPEDRPAAAGRRGTALPIAYFLGSRGVTPLSDMTLRRVFKRIAAATGIRVTPHMLRHTFCTLLSRSGVDDRLAREAMGHADLRMLQRYQHVYAGELAAAMRGVNLDLP